MIALFCDTLPDDPLNGNDLRIWNLLAEGEAVVFCASRREMDSAGRSLKTRLQWREAVALSHLSDESELWREVSQALRSRTGDVAAVRLVAHGAAAAFRLPPEVRRHATCEITDSMGLYFWRRSKDLTWRRAPMRKANALVQALRYRRLERMLAATSATVVVAAEQDRAFIGGRHSKVLTVGNGTSWTHKPAVKAEHRLNGRVVGFHGNFTWEPNVTAALYLATEVWPRVQQRLAEAVLTIAGGPLVPRLNEIYRQRGVRLEGYVADIRDWMSTCDVYAMPMTQGSGVKNKLAEAMAAGLPVITNDLGAEALGAQAKYSILVENNAIALADAIVSLLGNREERARLGETARAMSLATFDWTVYATQFANIVSKARVLNLN